MCLDCPEEKLHAKGYCSRCYYRHFARKWRSNNLERAREIDRRWKRNNPEKLRAHKDRYKLDKEKIALQSSNSRARKHGHKPLSITREQLKKFNEIVPFVCQVCSRAISGHLNHIDHCHITGRLRGRLCARCNMWAGQIEKNPDLLEKVRAYLTDPPAYKLVLD